MTWIGIAVFGLSAAPSFALPTFPPIVVTTYSLKPGAVQKADCQLCHVAAGPPKLNDYGTDVRNALRLAQTKTLTPEILHTLDSKDSDGDGFTNQAEFAADTLPGDPTSKPAGQPALAVTKKAEEPGPFSLQTLLFPRHAQHPVIVHFPIALFIFSLVFDILGYLKRNETLKMAGYYNLVGATIMAPVAIITGLLAWQFAYGGAPLQGFLLYHLLLAVTTTVLMGILLWTRSRQKGLLIGGSTRVYLMLAVAAFIILSLTGHIGGTLVYDK